MSQHNLAIHLPKKVFDCQEIKMRIHEILHENLHDKKYDIEQSTLLTKQISEMIKESLKMSGYEQYKFIIQTVICQEQNETLQVGCQSYWDSETDKFAQSIYVNQFLICIATVFAVFYY